MNLTNALLAPPLLTSHPHHNFTQGEFTDRFPFFFTSVLTGPSLLYPSRGLFWNSDKHRPTKMDGSAHGGHQANAPKTLVTGALRLSNAQRPPFHPLAAPNTFFTETFLHPRPLIIISKEALRSSVSTGE